MTVEQNIAFFAADCDLKDGDFLPVWLRPGGRGGGGGDFPQAKRSRVAARRIAINQCNRETSEWQGYVVERRGAKLMVFLVTELDPAGKHVGINDCWLHGWHFDLSGLQVEVIVQTNVPRLRPSALAERKLALAV